MSTAWEILAWIGAIQTFTFTAVAVGIAVMALKPLPKGAPDAPAPTA